MEEKVLIFDNGKERLNKLAKERSDREDFLGSLLLGFSAFAKDEKDLDSIMNIADAYADMGLYEFSNDYWFYYLSLCPKDKEKIAYSEISINYFYMDDVIMAGYYFQKKMAAGGVFDEDGTDGEIIRILEDTVSPRRNFKMVWPEGACDYSEELKNGKNLISKGDFFTAEKELKKIPEDAKQYKEALSSLSAIYIITERDEEGIKTAKEHMKKFGESMDAYCDLSAIYRYKGDAEKGKYYYLKALEFEPESLEVVYKAASCALDNGDEEKALFFMEKLLKERPYETRIRFFAALAEINARNFEKAKKHLAYLEKLSPENTLYPYYYRIACLGASGKLKNSRKLKYRENVTVSDEKEFGNEIKSIAALPDYEMKKRVKDEDVFSMILRAVEYSDSETRKLALYVAALCWNKKFEGRFSRLLLQAEKPSELKFDILYVLFAFSPVTVFHIVDADTFFKVKRRRFKWEKESAVFSLGYSLAVSRLFYAGDYEMEKLAKSLDKLFKKLKNPNEIFATKEEVAAMAVCFSGFKKFGKKENIAKLFGIKQKRFEELLKISGENKNEDN